MYDGDKLSAVWIWTPNTHFMSIELMSAKREQSD